MSKTPPPTPIDYESDWRTYDRWSQEDAFWLENQKRTYGDPAEVEAQTIAQMNEQGVSQDSNLWQNTIDKNVGEIKDYESERVNREKRLNSSLLYERLFSSNASPSHGGSILGENGELRTDLQEISSLDRQKEWYTENYGSVAPDNIYGPNEEQSLAESATARAKGAAGGSTTALENTPWI